MNCRFKVYAISSLIFGKYLRTPKELPSFCSHKKYPLVCKTRIIFSLSLASPISAPLVFLINFQSKPAKDVEAR